MKDRRFLSRTVFKAADALFVLEVDLVLNDRLKCHGVRAAGGVKRTPWNRLCRAAGGAPLRGSAAGAPGVVNF